MGRHHAHGHVAHAVEDVVVGQVAGADQSDAGLVEPTLDGASAAAAGATIADNLTFSTIWAEGDTSYPITAQTWIIAYQHQKDAAKAEALKAFLNFVLTDGQKIASTVNYAALPADLAAKAIAQIASRSSSAAVCGSNMAAW